MNTKEMHDAIFEEVMNNISTLPAAPPFFVRWMGKTKPFESIEDAQTKWNEFRRRTGAGASEIGRADVLDSTGTHIGHIAYNGRWFDDRLTDEQKAERSAKINAEVWAAADEATRMIAAWKANA